MTQKISNVELYRAVQSELTRLIPGTAAYNAANKTALNLWANLTLEERAAIHEVKNARNEH